MSDEMLSILACFRTILLEKGGKKPVERDWPQRARKRTADALAVILRKNNIGIATGDGITVVDIDPRNNGYETLEGIPDLGWVVQIESGEKKHKWPQTPRVRTPSGGVHLYFKGNTRSTKVTGIDIQCEGKQVVAPPSATDKGAYVWEVSPLQCEMMEIPRAFLAYIQKSHHEKLNTFVQTWDDPFRKNDEEWPTEYTLEAIKSLHGQSFDYQTWVEIGIATYNAGLPFSAWDELSASDPVSGRYSQKTCWEKWNGFKPGPLSGRVISKLARQNGWKPTLPEMDVSHYSFLNETEEPKQKPKEESKKREIEVRKTVDEIALELRVERGQSVPPPSRLGALLGDLDRLAETRQPRLARASALALLAWLSTARARSPVRPGHSRGSLATFVILVGGSGCGKGFFSSFPEMALDLSEELNVFANEVQSTHALLRVLKTNNFRIIAKAEIASMLNSHRDDPIKGDLLGTLCSAWSAEKISGKEAKKAEESVEKVDFPLLCILGGCTKTQFQEITENSNFNKGGLFYRCDFVMADEANMKTDREIDEDAELSPEVSRWINKKKQALISTLSSNKNEFTGVTKVEPKDLIKIDKEANDLLKTIRNKYKADVLEHEKNDRVVAAGMLNRVYEKICRTSAAIAMYEADEYPAIVSVQMVKWAWQHHHDVTQALGEYIGIADEDTQHAKLRACIVQAIERFRDKGNTEINYSELKRTNHGKIRGARPDEMFRALQDLEERGFILVSMNGSKGKKITFR